MESLKVSQVTDETGKIATMIEEKGVTVALLSMFAVLFVTMFLGMIGAVGYGANLLNSRIKIQDKQIADRDVVLVKMQSQLERLNDKIDRIGNQRKEDFFNQIGEVEMYDPKTGRTEKWRFKP